MFTCWLQRNIDRFYYQPVSHLCRHTMVLRWAVCGWHLLAPQDYTFTNARGSITVSTILWNSKVYRTKSCLVWGCAGLSVCILAEQGPRTISNRKFGFIISALVNNNNTDCLFIYTNQTGLRGILTVEATDLYCKILERECDLKGHFRSMIFEHRYFEIFSFYIQTCQNLFQHFICNIKWKVCPFQSWIWLYTLHNPLLWFVSP